MDSNTKEIINKIRSVWNKSTKETKGYFLRHIDADKLNNNLNNLQWVHPKEAMENINWCCDWVIGLTKIQIEFVKNNCHNFAILYSDQLTFLNAT